VQVLSKNAALLQAEPSPGLRNQEPLPGPGAKKAQERQAVPGAGRLSAEAPSSPPITQASSTKGLLQASTGAKDE